MDADSKLAPRYNAGERATTRTTFPVVPTTAVEGATAASLSCASQVPQGAASQGTHSCRESAASPAPAILGQGRPQRCATCTLECQAGEMRPRAPPCTKSARRGWPAPGRRSHMKKGLRQDARRRECSPLLRRASTTRGTGLGPSYCPYAAPLAAPSLTMPRSRRPGAPRLLLLGAALLVACSVGLVSAGGGEALGRRALLSRTTQPKGVEVLAVKAAAEKAAPAGERGGGAGKVRGPLAMTRPHATRSRRPCHLLKRGEQSAAGARPGGAVPASLQAADAGSAFWTAVWRSYVVILCLEIGDRSAPSHGRSLFAARG